jgi:hypothetical protein
MFLLKCSPHSSCPWNLFVLKNRRNSNLKLKAAGKLQQEILGKPYEAAAFPQNV